MRSVVICSLARTPIAKFAGSFASMKASELGAVAIRAAVSRAGVAPEAVEEVKKFKSRQARRSSAGGASGTTADASESLPPNQGLPPMAEEQLETQLDEHEAKLNAPAAAALELARSPQAADAAAGALSEGVPPGAGSPKQTPYREAPNGREDRSPVWTPAQTPAQTHESSEAHDVDMK